MANIINIKGKYGKENYLRDEFKSLEATEWKRWSVRLFEVVFECEPSAF